MDLSAERKQQIKQYYLQEDVVQEMVRVARYREFAPTYPQGYGSRPDSINYPGDFRDFVEKGAVAFHGSVETWDNPLLIGKKDMDDLRRGWDLIIDIDADEGMIYAKKTARALVDTLTGTFSIPEDTISVKFSGNRGFHLGIPQTAFPDRIGGTDLPRLYPRLPQAIVGYLRDRLRDRLAEEFRDIDPGLTDTLEEEGPYAIADIENDWGQRHLFRMPYSINEKSWLVSKPIPLTRIEEFEKPEAAIDKIDVDHHFLDPEKAETDSQGVQDLAVEALDWLHRQQRQEDEEKTTKSGDYTVPDQALDQEHFPPPIKRILTGLEDGRKRALFILITFLHHVGYDWDAIEKEIWDWNDRNDQPLDDTYVETQLNWHRSQDETLMPPNFDASGWYHDIGVIDDETDQQMLDNFDNPVPYAGVLKDKAENQDSDD